MARSRLNHRLVKKHRTYTVEEIGRLFDVHRNTVRAWTSAGLPTIDDRRPMLIMGEDLILFIQNRRASRRKRCGPGELYCVRCRLTKSPAGGVADYSPMTALVGNLTAICPDCSNLMHRCVNLTGLTQIREKLDVRLTQPPRLLTEIIQSTVNSDFK